MNMGNPPLSTTFITQSQQSAKDEVELDSKLKDKFGSYIDERDIESKLTLSELDKQLDETLNDIDLILRSRRQEFLESSSSKQDKLPIYERVSKLRTCKTHRESKMTELLSIKIPAHRKANYESIMDEFDCASNIVTEMRPENMLTTLKEFYADKSARMLQQNRLLLSRWKRFARASVDMIAYFPAFQAAQSFINQEYVSAVNRCERLSNAQNRINSNKKDALPNEKLPNQPEFTVADMLVYLRWLSSKIRADRDLEVFACRARILPLLDRKQILLDYTNIAAAKPCSASPAMLAEFGPISNYIESPPKKDVRVEDFMTEFESLICHFELETPMDLDKGRPFVYEAGFIFQKLFKIRVRDFELKPYLDYDALRMPTTKGDKLEANMNSATTGPSTSTGDEGELLNPARRIQYSISTVPRIRKADWIARELIHPRFTEVEEKNLSQIELLRDIDAELRVELDLVTSTNMDLVTRRLRDCAISIWGNSQKACKNGKVDQVNDKKSKPYLPPEATDSVRLQDLFDLGMKVPSGEKKLRFAKNMDCKKQEYRMLLKKAAQYQEAATIAEASSLPKHTGAPPPPDPAVALIFSELEVFACLQLRYTRIREMRAILLRQLNFFRSVEKRINVDKLVTLKHDRSRNVRTLTSADKDRHIDPITMAVDSISCMEILEESDIKTRAKKSLEGSFRASTTAANETSTRSYCTSSSEDIRTISKEEFISVSDNNGVEFIYDVAYQDLEELDNILLKVGSAYVNYSFKDHGKASHSYIASVKDRLLDGKAKHLTFLNPDLDRSQLLMELYEAEMKFGFAKVELVNAYLEVYEHCIDKQPIEDVRHIIVTWLKKRPMLTLNSSYFGQDYLIHTIAVKAESDMITSVMRHKLGKSQLDLSVYAEDVKNADPFLEGLPYMSKKEKTLVSLHHFDMKTNLFDISSAIQQITIVSDIFQEISLEMQTLVKACGLHLPSGAPAEGSIPAVHLTSLGVSIWKSLKNVWLSMKERRFQLCPEVQRASHYIDVANNVCPLSYPDSLLREVYNQYLIMQKLAPLSDLPDVLHTYYSDPRFVEKGVAITMSCLQSTLGQNKLFYSWIQTECYRAVYTHQLSEMRMMRPALIGRLMPLPLHSSRATESSTNPEEDDYSDVMEDSLHTELLFASGDAKSIRVGQLAYEEITVLANDSIDFHSLEGIKFLQSAIGLVVLYDAIRVQLLDKYLYLSAIEIHGTLLIEGLAQKSISGNTLGDKTTEYKPYVISFIEPKRQLRHYILRSLESLHRKAKLSTMDRDEQKRLILNEAVNWYCDNIRDVMQEFCAKAEWIKLVNRQRITVSEVRKGYTNFSFSNVTCIRDHSRTFEPSAIDSFKNLPSRAVEIYVSPDQSGPEPKDMLTKLWHLPFVTEIILDSGIVFNPPKTMEELSDQVYKSSKKIENSLMLNQLVQDIFALVSIFAHLSQERCALANVSGAREADYVYSACKAIKKEVQEAYDRPSFPTSKVILEEIFTLWSMKYLAVLDKSLESLESNSYFDMYSMLLGRKEENMRKLLSPNRDFSESLSGKIDQMISNRIGLQILNIQNVNGYIFNQMHTSAKRLCHHKFVELDEYFGFISTETGTGIEAIRRQKSFIEQANHIFVLRREFNLSIIGEGSMSSTELLKSEKKYTSHILWDSVKSYYKRGGSSSIEELLQSDNPISAPFNTKWKARQLFESCQIEALKSFLLQDYTKNCLYQAQSILHGLECESSSKVFRFLKAVTAPSAAGDLQQGFRITSSDFAEKSSMLIAFLSDLFNASVKYYKSIDPAFDVGKKDVNSSLKSNPTFTCRTSDLTEAVETLGIMMSKWQSKREEDLGEFLGSFYGTLIRKIREKECEVQIRDHALQDLRKEFALELRIKLLDSNHDIFQQIAQLSATLAQVQCNQAETESKIRSQVIREFSGVVDDLVLELKSVKTRFAEFQQSVHNQVRSLVAESRVRILNEFKENVAVPAKVKDKTEVIKENLQAMDILASESMDQQLAKLKLHSMYMLKEQSLKANHLKKLQELNLELKSSEDRRTSAVKEGETREALLKIQLSQLLKENADLEGKFSVRQNIQEVPENQSHRDGAIVGDSSAHAEIVSKLKSALKKYQDLDVERLIKELAVKNKELELLHEEKRLKRGSSYQRSIPPSSSSFSLSRISSAASGQTRSPSIKVSPQPNLSEGKSPSSAALLPPLPSSVLPPVSKRKLPSPLHSQVFEAKQSSNMNGDKDIWSSLLAKGGNGPRF